MGPHERYLREVFGFDGLRAGQRAVIGHPDVHRRALAIFSTGDGKSLCYELPALAYEGLTLVVSPLIALMEQQEVGYCRWWKVLPAPAVGCGRAPPAPSTCTPRPTRAATGTDHRRAPRRRA
jgi:hypothetical protein